MDKNNNAKPSLWTFSTAPMNLFFNLPFYKNIPFCRPEKITRAFGKRCKDKFPGEKKPYSHWLIKAVNGDREVYFTVHSVSGKNWSIRVASGKKFGKSIDQILEQVKLV